MCFSLEMSMGAAAIGLVNTLYVVFRTKDARLAATCIYFLLMEVLQVAQYMVADECSLPLNQFLTVLGHLHIAFQPVFSNILLLAFLDDYPKAKSGAKYSIVLSILAGIAMSLRWALSDLHTLPFPLADQSAEWMVGPRTCSFTGPTHIAWELPLLEVSYFIPSYFLHFFMMFGPMVASFIVEPQCFTRILPTATLFLLTGPVLAAFISGNRFEEPAIWCFFSVSQIACILMVIILSVKPTQEAKIKESKKDL